MDLKKLLERVESARRNPTHVVEHLREPRPWIRGGPLVNRMGLQVVRMLADRAAWLARPDHLDDDIRGAFEILERDGVLAMPDFLPADDFAALWRELEANRPRAVELGRYRHVDFGDNYGVDTLPVTEWPSEYPTFCRVLRDNSFLLRLASAASRRAMTYKPHMEVFHVYKPEPDRPHTDFDHNQFLHADRHFAFIKVFYYMDDVDADNAPYTFVRGSHRVSLARLKQEYRHSVELSATRTSGYTRTHVHVGGERRLGERCEEFVQSIGLRLEPVCGRANTLVVSNNQGFHKRGEMRGRRPRTTVNIDFKYLESVAQWMYPVLGRLYRD